MNYIHIIQIIHYKLYFIKFRKPLELNHVVHGRFFLNKKNVCFVYRSLFSRSKSLKNPQNSHRIERWSDLNIVNQPSCFKEYIMYMYCKNVYAEVYMQYTGPGIFLW